VLGPLHLANRRGNLGSVGLELAWWW
jgi:hypothetical protein